MPSAVRLADTCNGACTHTPRPNDEASTNVFINGRGSHRKGDHWITHCNPVPVCHDSNASEGSPNVFVNGKPKARVGDDTGCGSKMATGSANVFVNGG